MFVCFVLFPGREFETPNVILGTLLLNFPIKFWNISDTFVFLANAADFDNIDGSTFFLNDCVVPPSLAIVYSKAS